MHGTLQTYWRHRVPIERTPDVVPLDDKKSTTTIDVNETADQRASRQAAHARRTQKAAKRRAINDAVSTSSILSHGTKDGPRDTSPVRVPPVGPRICFTFRCVRHDHHALQTASTSTPSTPSVTVTLPTPAT
jgi:hypothetical protein